MSMRKIVGVGASTWVWTEADARMGLRLERTETLAQGGKRCDFRVSRGTPAEVEPEFLHV